MGVYIKGMEMPRSCKECGIRGVYCRTYIGFHHKDTARARKCPLVEIEDEPQTSCDTCKHKGEYAYCRLCGRLNENNYEPIEDEQSGKE